MYGWWKSFEHYCVPGSDPVATSAGQDRVVAHLRRHTTDYSKRPVLARKSGSQWSLTHKGEANGMVELASSQAVKYDRARKGGSRGNLGPVPPTRETSIGTVNLDR